MTSARSSPVDGSAAPEAAPEAAPAGRPWRVVVAGAGAGADVLDAVARQHGRLRLASDRVVTDPVDVPALVTGADLPDGAGVGLVVGGTAPLATALLERGLHVWWVGPLSLAELTGALRAARRARRTFRVLHPAAATGDASAFLARAREARRSGQPSSAALACRVGDLPAAVALLAAALGGVRPWHLDDAMSPPDPAAPVTGSVAGTALSVELEAVELETVELDAAAPARIALSVGAERVETPTGTAAPDGTGESPVGAVLGDADDALRADVASEAAATGRAQDALAVARLADALARAAERPRAEPPPLDADATAAATRHLDRVALGVMADLLGAGPGERTAPGRPASAPVDAALRRLRVAPRHAWIVRRWMTVLAEQGAPDPPATSGGLPLDAAALDRAYADLRFTPAMARFQHRVLAQLPALLRDEVDLLSLMYPEGDTATASETYQDSGISSRLNALAGGVVAEAIAARRGTGAPRVLELGGGLGATTAEVLRALGAREVDYLFSDVSRFFLVAAARRFAGRTGLRCSVLDIDRDLVEQGVAAGGTDVVVAANVLHNAVDVSLTLRRIRAVLAPGGVVVVVDSTRENYALLTSMLFLMSPREGAPAAGSGDRRAGTDQIFFGVPVWHEELAAAGLRLTTVLPPPGSPMALTGQSLLAARAEDR